MRGRYTSCWSSFSGLFSPVRREKIRFSSRVETSVLKGWRRSWKTLRHHWRLIDHRGARNRTDRSTVDCVLYAIGAVRCIQCQWNHCCYDVTINLTWPDLTWPDLTWEKHHGIQSIPKLVKKQGKKKNRKWKCLKMAAVSGEEESRREEEKR